MGVQPAAVAASDLNRDGRTDLVTSNWTSANFSALLGQCP